MLNRINRTMQGFTLIELIVVIAVISLLAGTMVPLAAATQAAQKIQNVEQELAEIAAALGEYYYDKGGFPSSLESNDFKGVYIMTGVGDDKIRDEWGNGDVYLWSTTSNPDAITVFSVGENGKNDGVSNEAYKISIYGAEKGNDHTRGRQRIIAAALANYLDGGGTVTGKWPVDREAMGLGEIYQKDGFGTDFRLDEKTLVLQSAGADRKFETEDDLLF